LEGFNKIFLASEQNERRRAHYICLATTKQVTT